MGMASLDPKELRFADAAVKVTLDDYHQAVWRDWYNSDAGPQYSKQSIPSHISDILLLAIDSLVSTFKSIIRSDESIAKSSGLSEDDLSDIINDCSLLMAIRDELGKNASGIDIWQRFSQEAA